MNRDSLVVHRFVTIEQTVRATQPEASDLRTLFAEWGLTSSTQEATWVIAFDAVEGLKTVTEVARGGFHDMLVYIPTVLSAVLAAHTDRFYIAHNHPAGPVTPTEEDVHLTGQIMAAANVTGLSFEDHIIVGPPNAWYSFFEEGRLKRAETLGQRAAINRPRAGQRHAPLRRSARAPAEKMPGYALLYLPGNASHWFGSSGRGIRYLSLCGVDRRGKRYRQKPGPRAAQCGLCEGAGGAPIPGSTPRREVSARAKAKRS